MKALRRLCLAATLLIASACRQDMHDQPRFEALEGSSFFADGLSARHQVEGTIARGELQLDPHLATGRIDGAFADSLPMPLTRELLERGRERFDIFCSACHDRAGYGEGMVVRRGMKQPPSFHIERLQQVPLGYFFDVMTRGFGAMIDVADRVPVADRWAIAAYVRTLQLSQHATLAEVAPESRTKLEDQR